MNEYVNKLNFISERIKNSDSVKEYIQNDRLDLGEEIVEILAVSVELNQNYQGGVKQSANSQVAVKIKISIIDKMFNPPKPDSFICNFNFQQITSAYGEDLFTDLIIEDNEEVSEE